MSDQHQYLSDILVTSSNELKERATLLFERESGWAYPAPLVLCGAGRLGQVVLRGLRQIGSEVLAFADNSQRLQGRNVDGCPVVSVLEAARRFGASAVFVVTIYTEHVLREQLQQLGVRTASARSIFFQHPAVFLPHGSVDRPELLASRREDIVSGLDVWADQASRTEYVAQIAWSLLENIVLPQPTPSKDTYFPRELIQLTDHEVFVDCGAFDGDSVRAMLSQCENEFESILALEPDPANYAALGVFIESLPLAIRSRITAKQVAVHSQRALLQFSSASGAGSMVSDEGDMSVQAERLDDLLASITPTFVKMDLEGAEIAALSGAAETLARCAPTLAICTYHQREHLWQIPRLIRDANEGYRLFLRRHSDECWETVCYATR